MAAVAPALDGSNDGVDGVLLAAGARAAAAAAMKAQADTASFLDGAYATALRVAPHEIWDDRPPPDGRATLEAAPHGGNGAASAPFLARLGEVLSATLWEPLPSGGGDAAVVHGARQKGARDAERRVVFGAPRASCAAARRLPYRVPRRPLGPAPPPCRRGSLGARRRRRRGVRRSLARGHADGNAGAVRWQPSLELLSVGPLPTLTLRRRLDDGGAVLPRRRRPPASTAAAAIFRGGVLTVASLAFLTALVWRRRAQ